MKPIRNPLLKHSPYVLDHEGHGPAQEVLCALLAAVLPRVMCPLHELSQIPLVNSDQASSKLSPAAPSDS